jgi:N-acetyl-gamma-glutamyl-phosphate reductase
MRSVLILRHAKDCKEAPGTNYCHIFVICVKSKMICFFAIDNLVKGASGQAIQNMNIVFELDETPGFK